MSKVTSHNENLKLTYKILSGMILGIIIGLIFNVVHINWVDTYFIHGLFAIMKNIFVVTLKMMVVPVVFFSLVVGILSLDSLKTLGRVGGKIVLIYIATTALAITIALILGKLFNAGVGLTLSNNANFNAVHAPSVSHIISNIFPSNPIKAMANGNMLQIISFSILFGGSLVMLKDKVPTVVKFFKETNDLILNLIFILLRYAPYGVFATMIVVFSTVGFQAFEGLLTYVAALVGALLIQTFVVYSSILKFGARVSPLMFFKKMWSVWLVSFSTDSSNATIPVNLRNSVDRLGISNSVASFTIPFGATVNMDGTAMMQGVATIAIAHMYGIQLGISSYLLVIFMATIASVGTAGVPGVGLITLSMVLIQIHVPVSGIAVLLGVDRLMDMLRTSVNVTGDAACSLWVAKSENKFNRKTFDDPDIQLKH